jgi:hypothetical protein
MALTTKVVTGTVTIAPGVPATGTVTAQLTDWLADPTDRLIASVPITFELDANGTIPAGSTLYATDDPGVTPTGVTYQLKIRPDRGHPEVRYVSLSRSAAEPVDIIASSTSAAAASPTFDLVHKAGTETITGDKDFTGALSVHGATVATLPDVATETARASAAETAITGSVTAEANRATAAEGGLTVALASETTRATNAEGTNAAAIALKASVGDADEVVVIATVKWPDGSGGTFTVTTKNATWLAIDAYTISHTLSGKTVTQAAVTRDSAGAITAKPALTVA